MRVNLILVEMHSRPSEQEEDVAVEMDEVEGKRKTGDAVYTFEAADLEAELNVCVAGFGEEEGPGEDGCSA